VFEVGKSVHGHAAAAANAEASGQTRVFSEENEVFVGSLDWAETTVVNVAGVFVGHCLAPQAATHSM
jgi:hypothetical protein